MDCRPASGLPAITIGSYESVSFILALGVMCWAKTVQNSIGYSPQSAIKQVLVITSYSIHYTKLYEFRAPSVHVGSGTPIGQWAFPLKPSVFYCECSCRSSSFYFVSVWVPFFIFVLRILKLSLCHQFKFCISENSVLS